MRDFVIALLVLFVGILIGVVYSQQEALENDHQAILQLRSSFQSDQNITELDVQDKCARQAEAFYKQRSSSYQGFVSYVDHWNRDLKKCFILITAADIHNSNNFAATVETDVLYDAFEEKDYGSFIGISSSEASPAQAATSNSGAGQIQWSLTPPPSPPPPSGTLTTVSECYVYSTETEKISCNSESDFLIRVAQYLGPLYQ
jgi:hypothetical protein